MSWVYEKVGVGHKVYYRVGYQSDGYNTWVERYEDAVSARAAVNYLNGGSGLPDDFVGTSL